MPVRISKSQPVPRADEERKPFVPDGWEQFDKPQLKLGVDAEAGRYRVPTWSATAILFRASHEAGDDIEITGSDYSLSPNLVYTLHSPWLVLFNYGTVESPTGIYSVEFQGLAIESVEFAARFPDANHRVATFYGNGWHDYDGQVIWRLICDSPPSADFTLACSIGGQTISVS